MGADAVLSGLTISARVVRVPGDDAGTIRIRGGAPTLMDLAILGGGTGLLVTDGSTAIVRDSVISSRVGVQIEDGAAPTLERDEILASEREGLHPIGIVIDWSDATTIVRDSTVTGLIQVNDQTVLIEGNDVTGTIALDYAGDDSIVRDNHVRADPAVTGLAAMRGGIRVGIGPARIERNDVSGFSEGPGIQVDSNSVEPARPDVLANTVHDNLVGIAVTEDAAPSIEGNVIEDNGIGIAVAGEGAAPIVRGNTLRRNLEPITVSDGATPVLDANTIEADAVASPSPLPDGDLALEAAGAAAAAAAGLVRDDPIAARAAYREAWRLLSHATQTGVPADRSASLEAEIRRALDELSTTRVLEGRMVASFEPDADPVDLVAGPDGALYVVDVATGTVQRVDPAGGQVTTVARVGDGQGSGMASPRRLVTAGRDLLILDADGVLWGWRPTGRTGPGVLRRVAIPGDPQERTDVVDLSSVPMDGARGRFVLFTVDPSREQVLRYGPTRNGRGFAEEAAYLATDDEPVAGFRDLFSDASLFALTADTVIRYYGGRRQEFALGAPPDDGDIRPGHDYRLFAGTSGQRPHVLLVHDARWGRVLAFDRSTGAYRSQWLLQAGDAPALDLRGIALVPRAAQDASGSMDLAWATPEGVFRAPLE